MYLLRFRLGANDQPWESNKKMAFADDKEELLLSCRYGELDEVKQFVGKYGAESLADIRDENGNTVLHMSCGNGHEGMLPLFRLQQESL